MVCSDVARGVNQSQACPGSQKLKNNESTSSAPSVVLHSPAMTPGVPQLLLSSSYVTDGMTV